MSSLFRREVIEGQQQAWLGNIQLVRPVPLAVLTALSVLIAAGVGTFLFEGRYTRKAHVAGYLVPDRGVLRLMPPQPGIVAESHVAEGRSVRRGDVLFVLSTDQASPSGDTQAAVQASLAARRRSLQETVRDQARLEVEEVAGLDRQLAGMRDELAQLDADARLHQKLVDNKQEELAQFESLSDYVSSAHLRTKRSEVLDAQTRLQALQLKRSTQRREIATLEARRREAPLRHLAAVRETERELALLSGAAAENAARQAVVIRAERDGIVTAVLAEPGQSVTPASALASLMPADTQLQAQLFAPSSAVGFVRPDQKVQLRYQAFPYQKFGHQAGQVLQVSRTPLYAGELAALPLPEALKSTASAEPLYRITVSIDRQAVQAYGQAQPLAAGMQLEADVLLDRRRLIEWIFEPLISVTGRV
jgi:membrane fusion protein